jgi:hypothetical protein
MIPSNIKIKDILGFFSNLGTEYKSRSKKVTENYSGLALSRAGFYGILKADGEVESLEETIVTFNSSQPIDLYIEGIVSLPVTPSNTGGINYNGYGILEVDGVVVYDGRLNSSSTSLTSLAALKSRPGVTGEIISLSGYISQGDGGGGEYYWDAASNEVEDDAFIISTGGTGRWKLLIKDKINVKSCGAISNYNSTTNSGTDATSAFNKALDKAFTTKKPVYVPAGSYKISSPLYIQQGVKLYGDSPDGNSGSKLFAANGFTGDGVILSAGWNPTYPLDRNWFWNSIESIYINCRDQCNYGIGIYNSNETCLISRTVVMNGIEASYIFAGDHAPVTCFHINTNGSKYGVKFTSHPTDGTTTGNGGVINIVGISGDSHDEALIYIDGAHRGSITGIKSEAVVAGTHKAVVKIQGSGTGGAAPIISLSGGCNRASADITSHVVHITGTTRPKVNILSFSASNTTNIIYDEVTGVTVPVTASAERIAGLCHGDFYFTRNIVLLEDGKLQFYSGGSVRDVIHLRTDQITDFKPARNNAGRLVSNDGQVCVQWKDDESGAAMLGFFGAGTTTKPIVTGATSDAVAKSIASALATLGLITNNNTIP